VVGASNHGIGAPTRSPTPTGRYSGVAPGLRA
jgi:hypothetical protein